MAEREQLVRKALRERGIRVSGLKVRESGRVVGLWGTVESDGDAEHAERVVADTMQVRVANHLAPRGAGRALADETPATAADEAIEALAEVSGMLGGPMQSRRYLAKPGDTLAKVARQFYADAAEWQRVLEANRDRVPDGDADGVLKTGTELIVP
jgi:nucleoid-associated protein YgaU